MRMITTRNVKVNKQRLAPGAQVPDDLSDRVREELIACGAIVADLRPERAPSAPKPLKLASKPPAEAGGEGDPAPAPAGTPPAGDAPAGNVPAVAPVSSNTTAAPAPAGRGRGK